MFNITFSGYTFSGSKKAGHLNAQSRTSTNATLVTSSPKDTVSIRSKLEGGGDSQGKKIGQSPLRPRPSIIDKTVVFGLRPSRTALKVGRASVQKNEELQRKRLAAIDKQRKTNAANWSTMQVEQQLDLALPPEKDAVLWARRLDAMFNNAAGFPFLVDNAEHKAISDSLILLRKLPRST